MVKYFSKVGGIKHIRKAAGIISVTCRTLIVSSIVPDTKYLRIRAKIPSIFRGGIRKLENVETLKLVLCGILEVEPGSFGNLPKLKTVALHDNVLEQLRAGLFNHLHL
ncbi:hypothetical protein JTB14_034967 [Gonioctena quinquepunctata]|nr:hypothetical protein JTB14_034967 [Gonioctena quinquepunctata]